MYNPLWRNEKHFAWRIIKDIGLKHARYDLCQLINHQPKRHDRVLNYEEPAEVLAVVNLRVFDGVAQEINRLGQEVPEETKQ